MNCFPFLICMHHLLMIKCHAHGELCMEVKKGGGVKEKIRNLCCYISHMKFSCISSSFILFSPCPLLLYCWWSHRPTAEIEKRRWLKNFWAVCSKLNQANFHLHIWGFHSIETCFKNWIYASSNIAACTISGHKQRAFLRILKLLYLHRSYNCCCASFTSTSQHLFQRRRKSAKIAMVKNYKHEQMIALYDHSPQLQLTKKERENTRKYEHGKVLWSPWKFFPSFLLF